MARSGDQWQAARVGTCVLMLVATGAWSAGGDYAMMMPKASTSLLLDIAAAGDRLVEVGERGHILYSDDRGDSWTQAGVPTSVLLTRVFFLDARLGWAVGHDGNILASTDGGLHWELQRAGVVDQARINQDNVARAKAQVDSLRTQLADSSGARGQELDSQLEEAEHGLVVAREILAEPVYPPPLMDVRFANGEQGWAVGAFGTLLRTTDAGRHWDDWSHKLPNPDELHLNGVAADAAGNLYLASEWGYVFLSSSGGETWQAVETGYEGSVFGVLADPVTDSVFAYGLRGTVYRSTDHGRDWVRLDLPIRDSLFGAACSAEGKLVFVGQDGGAVMSTDGGGHFTVLQTDTRRGLYGVTATAGGGFVATGDGGFSRLAGPDREQAGLHGRE